MSPTEQNLAIAEEDGWTFYGQPGQAVGRPKRCSFHDGPCLDIPNYTSDLVAIHGVMEKRSHHEKREMIGYLRKRYYHGDRTHTFFASPAHCAEAFLKITKLYKE